MPFILYNLLFAGVPSLAALYFLSRSGEGRAGSRRLVLPAFFLGFLAVIPALFLELSLRPYESVYSGIGGDLFRAFLVAGAVEEGMKFLAVRIFLYPRRDFGRITDGIAATTAAGLGFAFFENIFYTFGNPWTLVLRGLTSVPLHAVASAILGYYMGLSKFSYKPLFFRGFLIATAVHGAYNFFLFQGSWYGLFAVPVLIIAFRLVRRLYADAVLRDEREGRS